MVDNCVNKLSTNVKIYIGATAASDTADLNNGRGLTTGKPFATLTAAMLWALNQYAGKWMIDFVLQSDITISSAFYIHAQNIVQCRVMSDALATRRKINLSAGARLHCWSGNILFDDIEIVGNSAQSAFCARETSLVTVAQNVVVNGSFTEAIASAMLGRIYAPYAIGGSPTGPRYKVWEGGGIFTGGRGANAFPGTTAGSVGSGDGSVYC